MTMYPGDDVNEILYGTYNPLSNELLSEEYFVPGSPLCQRPSLQCGMQARIL